MLIISDLLAFVIADMMAYQKVRQLLLCINNLNNDFMNDYFHNLET